MAQQADLTVFDGAATPVSHLLKVVDNKVDSKGVRLSVWRENITTLPAEAQIRAELRSRTLPSGTVETRLRVVTPVMESVSGANAAGYTAAPKVAYEDSDEWVKYSSPRSTANSRQINSQILRNLMNNVVVTTPAVASGFAKEAFVDGFLPT